eukprot:756695-Hanusia_phi.AAC.6
MQIEHQEVQAPRENLLVTFQIRKENEIQEGQGAELGRGRGKGGVTCRARLDARYVGSTSKIRTVDNNLRALDTDHSSYSGPVLSPPSSLVCKVR